MDPPSEPKAGDLSIAGLKGILQKRQKARNRVLFICLKNLHYFVFCGIIMEKFRRCLVKEKIIVTNNQQPCCVSIIQMLRERGYSVVEAPLNGDEVLRLIASERPQLVVMDAFMVHKDAIGVMREVAAADYPCPYFFVSTVFCNGKLFQALIHSGVSYLICSPYDPASVLQVIQDYLQPAKPGNMLYKKQMPEEAVSSLLHQMGMPPHLKGYADVKDAIVFCIRHPDTTHAVTKVLYPAIAKKKSTPYQVERNIRYALRLTWKKGNVPFLKECFSSGKESAKCPTNAEFIALAMEYIQMHKTPVFIGK